LLIAAFDSLPDAVCCVKEQQPDQFVPFLLFTKLTTKAILKVTKNFHLIIIYTNQI
jgi:hypothetical protein